MISGAKGWTPLASCPPVKPASTRKHSPVLKPIPYAAGSSIMADPAPVHDPRGGIVATYRRKPITEAPPGSGSRWRLARH